MSAGGATWADAGDLSIGGPNTFDLSSVTEAGLARPYNHAYWQYTPTHDNVLTIDTFASVAGDITSADTQMFVYAGGTSVDDATQVGFNDDSIIGAPSGASYLSKVTININEGTTYHILVGTYNPDGDTVSQFGLNASLLYTPIEGAVETIVVDLPAFNIVPPYEDPDGPEAGYLSVKGDGNTITMTSDAQPIAIGNFGDGPGAPDTYTGDSGIFPPDDTPDWAYLTGAQYVVTCQASATADATGSWSSYTPPPTKVPNLAFDNTSSPDELTIDPVLTSMGDVVSTNDLYYIASVAHAYSRSRVWAAGTSTGSIEVDYIALRLTFEIPAEITGTPDPVRRRFY